MTNRRRFLRHGLGLLVGAGLSQMPVLAQGTGIYQVFLQHSPDGSGRAMTLVFIDMVLGTEARLGINGERFTPLADSVMFYDPDQRRVRVATPDGQISDHPFVRQTPDAQRLDWVVAGDKQQIAWTLTTGSPTALVTRTHIANVDGSRQREVFVDGPYDGFRSLPVAFSADQQYLYMDYHPNVDRNVTLFRQYASLFSVELATSATAALPGEPGCFCGAAIGTERLVRLAVNDDESGFDVKVFSLISGVETTIPALSLRGYTWAGDVLLAPNGSRAVYALAQVRDPESPRQTARTIFVVVDLDTMTQTALTSPITTFVRPAHWTEDNSAVIFTSPTLDGTWKINLRDGRLDKIADLTFVATLRITAS